MTQELPREIDLLLRRISRRLRWVALLRGIGTLALVIAVAALVGMAFDFALTPAGPARWIGWSLWVGLSAFVLVSAVLRPAARRASDLSLAALAERADPALGERLVGSVALREAPHGSPAMAQALTREAAALANKVNPARAVDGTRASRSLSLGVAALVLVALPSLVRPDPFRYLLARFAAPWLDLDPVGRFVFRVTPGDRTIAIGSDLKVSARLDRRFDFGGPLPTSASIEWTDGTGTSRRLPMASLPAEADSGRLFEVSIPRVEGSIDYRIVAATERSKTYAIEAVAPPRITGLIVSVEPPDYTKRPISNLTLPEEGSGLVEPPRLEVVEGSKIRFAVTAHQRVTDVTLGWPGEGGKLADVAATEGKTVAVVADLPGSFTYTLNLRDAERELASLPASGRLIVKPDAPPTLTIQQFEGPKESSPDDTLGIGLAARDDFAVASVQLHYQIRRKDASEADSPESGTVEARPPGLGGTSVRGDATMPLKPLKLQPGDSISYKVRVADNRPAPKGPNVVWSEDQGLTIVEKAEPLLARRDRMQRDAVKARLDGIKADAQENRREAEQLRYAADAAKRETKGWDKEHETALAAREAAAAKVRDDLKDFARDLQADPGYRDLARPAEQVANVEAEAGRERLAAAAKAPDAAARLDALRQADARLGSTQNRLEELSRKLDALAKADADRQALRELAAREDAIAEGLAEAKPENLEALQAEQDAARKDLDDMLARSPELRAGVVAEQAEEAAKLAEKAKALAERQREEARKTTDLAQPNGKLKELVAEQRKIEDDARRLALDVDEPLHENGRRRVDIEPLRDAADPLERGDINLGRQKLDQAENELRRLARDLDDVMEDPKALARRLAQRQNVLAQRAGEAVRVAKGKPSLTAADRAALAEVFKPLIESQRAIAKLAEAIRPADPGQAKQAADAARVLKAAADPLVNVEPKEVEAKQGEAKAALYRLAEALPDPWKRQEQARQGLDQARRTTDEVHRDLERHLRETAPRPGHRDDPAKLANDLAERLKPLAAKQAEAAKAIAEMKPDAVSVPQQRRAERRAQALADAIEAIRKEAAASGPPQGLKAVPNWQVAGPFPMNAPPPFDPAKSVDFKAKLKGKDGKPVAWKGVADGSRIDLGQALGQGNEQSAFAVAEITSPDRRTARLDLGADDTLQVWLNGKQIHNFQGNNAFSPDGTRLTVELKPGVNRLVAKVGNRSDRWEFGAMISPPHPAEFKPDRLEALRDAMPLVQAEARASMERLARKMQGHVPSDDLADELAAEAKAATAGADPVARAGAVSDQRRLSTALRNLDAPDAPLLQAEAVRLAERSAEVLADPKADAAPALKQAADAAQALADRLTDRLSPRAEAARLAQAQRALNAPEAAKSPSVQAERQNAIADRTTLLASKHPQAIDATRRARTSTDHAAKLTPIDGEAPPDPAEAREAAAKALEELAKSAPDTPPLPNEAPPPRLVPDDPELPLSRDRVAQARALAQRQRRVRERLQAIVGDRIEPQEKLRDDAAALGRELAELRDASKQTAPRGHGQAEQAADLLTNHAPKAMEQGASQLAEGKPREAKESQRRAAEVLERAAQVAEDLASTLKADRDALSRTEGGPPASPLGEARAGMADAARALSEARQSPDPARSLAKAQSQAPSARKAADSLRLAAHKGSGPPQGEMDAPDAQSESSPGGNDPKSRPITPGTADLTALQSALQKQTGRPWGELPGHLRSEILQRAQGKYRDDYARLIQLYFQEIATDGGKD